MPSIILTKYYQIIYRILNRLQVFDFIVFNQKTNTLIFAKILICVFCTDCKATPKRPNAGISIRYLIFAHFSHVCNKSIVCIFQTSKANYLMSVLSMDFTKL